MSTWDRTYQSDELKINGYRCTVDVTSAARDDGRVFGQLLISTSTDNGSARCGVELTPQQMRQVAHNLMTHATRMEEFPLEIAVQPMPEAA